MRSQFSPRPEPTIRCTDSKRTGKLFVTTLIVTSVTNSRYPSRRQRASAKARMTAS
jgi:hypothetical protein